MQNGKSGVSVSWEMKTSLSLRSVISRVCEQREGKEKGTGKGTGKGRGKREPVRMSKDFDVQTPVIYVKYKLPIWIASTE